jgi:glycosyltransferase involved in cell wall biosynthesis
LISAIILTLNEAEDLPNCLKALDWTDQNFVLDSGSTDETCEIALRMGADLYKNKFMGFGQQRCWAIDNIPVKSDWILFIDADEVCTPKFSSAVLDAIQNSKNDTAGFYCCWKLMLYGKWLKLTDSFPRWQFRILKKGKARYRDAGHAMKESDVQGKLGYIKEPYLHYAFSKGWTFWFNRHNKYSTLEAKERLQTNFKPQDMLSKDQSIRKEAIKQYMSKIPGWPILRFIHSFFFKGGILEGIPGLLYSVNISIYEYMIQLKMLESKLVSPKKPR